MTTIDARPSAPGGFADDDLEHLRLLSIFHYVVAGTFGLVALLPGIHLVLGLLMVTGHLAAEDDASRVIGGIMTGCASFVLTLGLGLAALIALAGRSLQQRRRYTFCLVIAAVLCLFFPFGTALGVFAIIVLIRPSVKALFDSPSAAPARI